MRPTLWCSLVFQHRATRDPERQTACLRGLESDPRLDDDTRSAIARWLRAGEIDPQQAVGLLERLQAQDMEAATTLDILRTLQEVKDVDTDSPQEAQEAARGQLRRCLQASHALADSYAAICVIEAYGKVGVRMDDLASYRQLLDYERVLLDRLSDDAAALEPIATPLAKLRQKMGTMTFTNIGTRFGYANEDIEKADEGDPGALRRVALAMLEGEAHPEALMGVVPWPIWLLRWGGTGTTMACRNVLAAITADAKAGRLAQPAAHAIRSLVGELMFSSAVDPSIVRDALGAVKRHGLEDQAIQLMLLKDRIETGGSTSLADVEAALARADDLGGKVGATGIAAWFRTVLAEHNLVQGLPEQAAELARQAIDELDGLQSRKEYTTRLARAVNLAVTAATARGDPAEAARLQRDHAEVLAAAGTREQELRDEHGPHLADDFRPTARPQDE